MCLVVPDAPSMSWGSSRGGRGRSPRRMADAHSGAIIFAAANLSLEVEPKAKLTLISSLTEGSTSVFVRVSASRGGGGRKQLTLLRDRILGPSDRVSRDGRHPVDVDRMCCTGAEGDQRAAFAVGGLEHGRLQGAVNDQLAVGE